MKSKHWEEEWLLDFISFFQLRDGRRSAAWVMREEVGTGFFDLLVSGAQSEVNSMKIKSHEMTNWSFFAIKVWLKNSFGRQRGEHWKGNLELVCPFQDKIPGDVGKTLLRRRGMRPVPNVRRGYEDTKVWLLASAIPGFVMIFFFFRNQSEVFMSKILVLNFGLIIDLKFSNFQN